MTESAGITYSASTTSLENPVILSVHYLDNNANVDAGVNLNYTCSPNDCSEITTKYYETNLRSGSLALSKKNVNWAVTGTEKINVSYNTNVADGKMTVTSIESTLDGSTWVTGLPLDYTLVYYADEEFANDGTRLATPGQVYALAVNSAIPISTSDGNLKDAANYCQYDQYDHCRGIKLWAVRTNDLSDHTLNWASGWQSTYYFETDMLGWDHLNDGLTNPLDVLSNTELDFVIVSEFPKMMIPNTYTLTTTVNIA